MVGARVQRAARAGCPAGRRRPKLAEMLTTLSLRLYAPERSWTIELLTIESAPVALVGLFRGGTIGKAVVRLYQ